MNTKSIPFILLISIVTTLFIRCGNASNQIVPSQPLPRFPVISIEARSVTTFLNFPASIEGEVNSEVRPKVTGYIQKVLVDEGQQVKQGQLLFKLETQSLSQDAVSAKANVNAAQVEVDKLIPLVEKNIISNVQLETAKAKLLQAKGSYNSLNATIDYANIKSPVNGVVGSINYREGALVSALNLDPITQISSIENVYAYFSMNETAFLEFFKNAKGSTVDEKVKTLPKIKLLLANNEVYPKEGTIETVTGNIDQQTGTVTFRAKFNNAGGLLRNGSSGTVMIPTAYENAIVVPTESTYEKQGKTFVYTVVKDSLVATPITILANADKLYVVRSGLEKGSMVLAKGLNKVRPGAKIDPKLTPLDSIVNSYNTVFK